MSVQSFAPIVERNVLTAAAAATTIGDGANFRVYGIVATAAATAILNVLNAAGTATLFTVNLIAGVPFVMDISFIADAGLSISATTANVNCTVLRGHAGT